MHRAMPRPSPARHAGVAQRHVTTDPRGMSNDELKAVARLAIRDMDTYTTVTT